MKTSAAFSLTLLLFSAAVSDAMVAYDESVSGDFSPDFAAPTPVSFSNGANTIIGDIGANGEGGVVFGPSGNDSDRFTFTVPAGSQISSLTVDVYDATGNVGAGSLIAYVASGAFSSDTDNDNNALFSAGSGDILPTLAGGPLGPGAYSFWLQETASSTIDYQVTFTQVVPEPSAATLFVGAGALMRRRRRRR